MKQIRVFGINVNVKESTLQEIEDIINKAIIMIEQKCKGRILNVIPCGDNFLILYEEDFYIMK